VRVVHGPDGIDALNMPEDQPADNEVVHVCRRLGPARVMFMCGRGRGQRSGVLAVADYEWLPDVDGEPLRDTSLVLKVAVAGREGDDGVEVLPAELQDAG
jgi:hypothetical protein